MATINDGFTKKVFVQTPYENSANKKRSKLHNEWRNLIRYSQFANQTTEEKSVW